MVTGAPVRTRRCIAGLIMLAVLVMMFGQVTAMPVATASWQDQAVNQVSASMRTELGEQEPRLPCHHHGSERGPLCCSAGACLMLMFSLPASAPAMHEITRHKLAYGWGVVYPPPGTTAAPLLPPPRSLV